MMKGSRSCILLALRPHATKPLFPWEKGWGESGVSRISKLPDARSLSGLRSGWMT